MTFTNHAVAARLTGVLLLTALTFMIASAVIVVPSGLTLNPAEPVAALTAVDAHLELHLIELGLDVIGWVALTSAALAMAAQMVATGHYLGLLPTCLLAAAGLAGVLHDAGNLAVTQLTADLADPATVAVTRGVLLTAKWAVNLAGLLWVAATAAAALHIPMTAGLRRAGIIASLSGIAAVILPWTTGSNGPSAPMEQVGYTLHLPIMTWFGILGWRELRARPRNRAAEPNAAST